MFALPITLAIVPALLLLWFFHSRDAYPEPPRVVWATFFLGVLSIFGVLIVALPAKGLLVGITNPYGYGIAEAFVCAAIPEECFKFLVLYAYAARHREFNEPMDGVIYGVAASLGFATLENVLYVSSHGVGVGVMRAFSAVPGHAFMGAVMGYYVGRARFASGPRGSLFGLALLVPILLHGMYDFPILTLSHFEQVAPKTELPVIMVLMVLVSLFTLIFEGRLALRLVRRLRVEQDANPGSGALVAAPPAPVRRTFSLLGWVQVVSGGTLVTGVALLMVLLVIGAVATDDRKDVKIVMLVGVMISVLPLLLGLWLFRAGIRHLNRAESAVPR